MEELRLSRGEDIPAIRALWRTAFGDSDAYLDNFFKTCYRPERVLVLEEGGSLCSMTAWFDTALLLPGGQQARAAYLYAVATRPDCRGRGCSSRLLAWADGYFRSLSIPAVTTVPAESSLHAFFGRNGFRECFRTAQWELGRPESPQTEGEGPLTPVSAGEYGAVREELLAGSAHIAYPGEALTYQAGCCALSGGGLFAEETRLGKVCLCVERGEDGTVVVKELLGSPQAGRAALARLFGSLPWERAIVRTPAGEDPGALEFGMLKWLEPTLAQGGDWSSTAYLGLAFD